MGTVSCANCGRALDERSDLAVKPPCPYCGSAARSIEVHAPAAVAFAVGGKAIIETIQERVVRRWPLYAVVVGIVVVTSLLGLVLDGWLTVAVSLALGFVGVVLSDWAASRIRHDRADEVAATVVRTVAERLVHADRPDFLPRASTDRASIHAVIASGE